MNGSSVDTSKTQLPRDERQSAQFKSRSSRHPETSRPQPDRTRRASSIHPSRNKRAPACQSREAVCTCELRESRTASDKKIAARQCQFMSGKKTAANLSHVDQGALYRTITVESRGRRRARVKDICPRASRGWQESDHESRNTETPGEWTESNRTGACAGNKTAESITRLHTVLTGGLTRDVMVKTGRTRARSRGANLEAQRQPDFERQENKETP
eukprot:2720432-Pleurochrysis_carterae.AAC.1